MSLVQKAVGVRNATPQVPHDPSERDARLALAQARLNLQVRAATLSREVRAAVRS